MKTEGPMSPAPATPADIAGAGPAAALDLLQAGGAVVWILILMSVVATAVTFLKLWQFHRANVARRRNARDALRLYKTGRAEEALAAACRDGDPAGEALARGIRGLQRGVPESKVREELFRYGGEVLESLRGGFRILEVTASMAPLLGLFGTVLGMIEAFRQLEAAGSQVDAAVLSGGIWQALLTTAAGLGVAIPVVAVLNWLERRVDGLAHEMENLVTQLFTEDLSELTADKDLAENRR